MNRWHYLMLWLAMIAVLFGCVVISPPAMTPETPGDVTPVTEALEDATRTVAPYTPSPDTLTSPPPSSTPVLPVSTSTPRPTRTPVPIVLLPTPTPFPTMTPVVGVTIPPMGVDGDATPTPVAAGLGWPATATIESAGGAVPGEEDVTPTPFAGGEEREATVTAVPGDREATATIEPAGTIPGEEEVTPTPDFQKQINQGLDALESAGQIVYNKPEEMTVGVTEKIEALLIWDTAPEVTERLEGHLEGEIGTPSSETIRQMSSWMMVRLVPVDEQDFRVQPLQSAEMQPVDRLAATSWSWRVTPLRSGGTHKLELQVIAIVGVDGENLKERHLPSKTIVIPVKVNPVYTMGVWLRGYGWILVVLAVVIAGVVAARKGYLPWKMGKPPGPADTSPASCYLELEIHLQELSPKGYPVQMECAGQEYPKGYLPATLVEDTLSLPAQQQGEYLFNILMGHPHLRDAWVEVRGRSLQRRVRLRIDEAAPELHVLPWELLRDSGVNTESQTLAADADTPFSRYLPRRWDAGQPLPQHPVKMLVAIANPLNLVDYGLAALDVDAEMAFIRNALSVIPSEQLEITFLPQPITLAGLDEALKDGYHILHFMGHGRYSESRDEAALFFANAQNLVHTVTGDELAGILRRQTLSLRLIFLSSCQTAKQSPADAFRGLAPRLVGAGVPAVVAMQELIALRVAQAFTRTFYRRLFVHGIVDLACNEARSTLMATGLPGSSIPVLFSRLPDNQLFNLQD